MTETVKGKLPEAQEASSKLGGSSSKKQAAKGTKHEEESNMNAHMDRKRPFKSISDERDEQVHNHVNEKHKNQARAPPSPAKQATMSAQPGAQDGPDAFDWIGEGRFHLTENGKTDASRGTPLSTSRNELKYRNSPAFQRGDHRQNGHHDESSFLLFSHSFDTISESGDYMAHGVNYGERAPTSPHTHSEPLDSPATPRIEITLPELGHCDSDCSMADVSPIKVANRHLPAVTTPAAAADPSRPSLANSGQFPPHQVAQPIAQPGGAHVQFGGTRNSNQPTAIYSAPPHYDSGYSWKQYHPGYPMEREDHVSNPFYVIRSSQRAFANCTYLLPCLRENMISVNINRYGHIRRYEGNPELDAGSMELVIATRRIETAICAFGGSLNPRRPSHTSSIFRLKEDRSSNKYHYEQQLPHRYQVTEGRISWEVEANPPVNIEQPQSKQQAGKRGQSRNDSSTKRAPHVISDDTSGGKRTGTGQSSSHNPTDAAAAAAAAAENEKKMKYRCKLCGQPKQNHTCTFRSSLQRNIGVQVYSAVNAYTACEPGTLAPSLSKMNNFVSYDSSGGHGSPHATTPDQGYPPVVGSHNAGSHCHPSTVTPQTIRQGGTELHSPQSSLSTHSQELSPHMGPPSASRSGSSHDNRAPGNGDYHVHFSHRAAAPGDMRRSRALVMEGHSRPYHNSFAPSVALRPEHYRTVTPFRNNEAGTESPDAYKYPPIPVSFTERKRLSDTLFYFSRKLPNMTRDCGAVLREAREVDDWDQAVAELLTQVVVGLYCGEGDLRLDGLQQFLLTLGVSC